MLSRRACLGRGLALMGLMASGMQPALAAPTGKSIVIYHSRTGEVDKIAHMIAQATGAELLQIEPKVPYADEYSAMTGIAQEEKRQGRRREIATTIPDLSAYDTVYIGSPVWWNGLSTPMWTFLKDHPLDGKTVATFHASGSSSASASRREAEGLCPKAHFVGAPFLTSGGTASTKGPEVTAWLKTL